jgi:hypothetical protein
MSDVSITDQVHLTGSVQVADDSSLSLANLKSLNFSNLPVISDFDKPIDHFPIDKAEVGLGFGDPVSDPSKLAGNTAPLAVGGIDATLSICTFRQKTLFDDDQFAPSVQIKTGECWAGFSIAATLQESAGTSLLSGAGVVVTHGTTVTFGTLVHFPEPGSGMPSFKDGLAMLLRRYSVPYTPEKLRATPLGNAYTAETSGVVSLGAIYSAPLETNPLATLGLPFNLTLGVQPRVQASIKGSIALAGCFILRTYLASPGKLIFGLYKQKKTTLTASFSATAGIGVDVAKTDVLAQLLDVVVPPADVNNLHLDDSQKADLNKALKGCVDQSISIALNATCSASQTDEAAVIYELDLMIPDLRRTDAALSAALRGDWSVFDTLPNARLLRNIVRELHERNHKININLLGLYNATSLTDYLTSTTVIHDEHGQIAIVDKAEAKTISAGTTPYAAKPDKLRSLLAQAFVATIAYGATAGKIGITSFSVQQSLLEYRAQANVSDLTRELLLARAVGLPLTSDWDAVVKSGGMFNQSRLYLSARYDADSVMRLFYQDVHKRTPRLPAALDRIGRDTKIALLDPLAVNSVQRRKALSNDDIWNAMTASGNVNTFNLIPGLAKLDATAITAIRADFLDIRWWSDAMQRLTPRLTAVLTAADESQSSDLLSDGAFMAARKGLESALAHLASKTQGAFGEGWGLAVMVRLATTAPPSIETGASQTPAVEMDIGWNQKFEHYQLGNGLALGHTSGT